MSVKTNVRRILPVFLLIPLWILLRSVYRDRIGAFGCFDDCNNIMGGYFLLAGKRLFSEIFFNHMPLMAYVSALIQQITHPDSLYMLLYHHRMSMIYVSIAGNVLLALRFGWAGVGFALLYETTKGFVFGERFLAEPMIIYPLVYLFGLAMESLSQKTHRLSELLIAAVGTWFVVFMREPYIPLVLVLYGVILWGNKKGKRILPSLLLFTLLSLGTLVSHSLSELWFNVYSVNTLNIRTEADILASQGLNATSIILYPLLLFFKGSWNLLRMLEVALVVLLAVLSISEFKTRRGRIRMAFFICVLTLANIRPVLPGTLYYGAFHHLIWYGLLIFSVTRLIRGKLAILVFGALCVFAVASPQNYMHERIDRQTEFAVNYTKYFVTGEAVRLLASGDDTLFLDGQDDLIYWQAKRFSSYPYSWYTSLMPYVPKYTDARIAFLADHPPTFYYGNCTGSAVDAKNLPQDFLSQYDQLYAGDVPACLFIAKTKARTLTADQLELLAPLNFRLPK